MHRIRIWPDISPRKESIWLLILKVKLRIWLVISGIQPDTGDTKRPDYPARPVIRYRYLHPKTGNETDDHLLKSSNVSRLCP